MSIPYHARDWDGQTLCNSQPPPHRSKYPPSASPAMTVTSQPLRERVFIAVRRPEIVVGFGPGTSVERVEFPMDRTALAHAYSRLEPHLEHVQRTLIARGYLGLDTTTSNLSLNLFMPATRSRDGSIRGAHQLLLPKDLFAFAKQPGMYGWDNRDLHGTLEELALDEPEVIDLLKLMQCVFRGHVDIILSNRRDGRDDRRVPEGHWMADRRRILQSALGCERYGLLIQASNQQARRIEAEERKEGRCGGCCNSGCGEALLKCGTQLCCFAMLAICM